MPGPLSVGCCLPWDPSCWKAPTSLRMIWPNLLLGPEASQEPVIAMSAMSPSERKRIEEAFKEGQTKLGEDTTEKKEELHETSLDNVRRELGLTKDGGILVECTKCAPKKSVRPSGTGPTARSSLDGRPCNATYADIDGG